MKIAFFWTWEFSKNTLQWIIRLGVRPLLTVSQPNKPVGRKKQLQKTPVKYFSEQHNIPVMQPAKLKQNEDFFEELKKLDLDFIVVVAYGKIIPKEILDIPKYGCINIHGSILPKYRWASPIQESLKNGDELTGLTIMYMSEGMDEGDILSVREVEVDKVDTTSSIFGKFEKVGPKLLLETLEKVMEGSISGLPQNEDEATYCKKILKADGEIDFHTMSSDEIKNRFRAYTPWPGIYSYFWEKKIQLAGVDFIHTEEEIKAEIWDVIKVWKKVWIICADGQPLFLKEVKLEWKKCMDILSFINGNKDFLNYKFSLLW